MANERIRQLLQENADYYQHCTEHAVIPFRIRVSIPKEKKIFNKDLSIDMMYIDMKPVLYVVGNETGFQNESFILKKPWKHYGLSP